MVLDPPPEGGWPHSASSMSPTYVKILGFISEWNGVARPFNWTSKSFEKILAKIDAALAAA
jgi:hypothetical protein